METVIKFWFEPLGWQAQCLRPLSWLYKGVMRLRALLYRYELMQSTRLTKPVIVVGNLTVGGNGKSPMVAWLIDTLRARGLKPGIVSRGYGGRLNKQPTQVAAKHTAADVGDEALMLYRQTAVPTVVGVDRAIAAQMLVDRCGCDVVVSDDGLQHLAMKRDLEFIMIDAQRQFGNDLCLPAGPLRESLCRLKTTPWHIYTSGDNQPYRLDLLPHTLYRLGQPDQTVSLQWLQGKNVHAVAAIGNPKRFFDTLRDLGAAVVEHPMQDHEAIAKADLSFDDSSPVIITEKDAVKCEAIAPDRVFVLAIKPVVSAELQHDLLDAFRLLFD